MGTDLDRERNEISKVADSSLAFRLRGDEQLVRFEFTINHSPRPPLFSSTGKRGEGRG
jgi:hypothetical protein